MKFFHKNKNAKGRLERRRKKDGNVFSDVFVGELFLYNNVLFMKANNVDAAIKLENDNHQYTWHSFDNKQKIVLVYCEQIEEG